MLARHASSGLRRSPSSPTTSAIAARSRSPRRSVRTGRSSRSKRPPVPAVRRSRLGPQPDRRLHRWRGSRQDGLRPSPEADRATLLRRLSFDLTGLPPTPEEVERFLADRSPDAYERLVDRLLASPHYGERWAQHWLDLARYADTDGFEFDQARPERLAVPRLGRRGA